MLKVMHFVPSIQRGGAERQVACIVENCADIEHWLVSLYIDKDNYLRDIERLRIIRSRKIMGRLREFNALTRVQKPDVIYAWAVLPYLLALIASLGKNIKVINGSIRHGVFKKSIGGYLRLILLHMSKYVVANSFAGIRANRLKRGLVLYNGIDEKFNREKQNPPVWKTNDPEKIILISVANLVPYKDYKTIFRALYRLRQGRGDFIYQIIGDGSQRRIHEQLVDSLGLSNNVVFLGRIPNPEDFLGQADIFIHSSKGEGCSNAILEAMYMGLPVIATDTGGTAEITGSNAFLYPYQDIEALYQGLSELMQDVRKRKSMGEESYRIACSRFTIQRMISDYGRIIRAVANDYLADVSDLKYSSQV